MFGATFKLVTRVGLPLFLEHQKMIVLKINILASNDYFSYRNVFQNGVNTLSKLLTIFCQKAQFSVWFGPYDFVQIAPACDLSTYQIMYGETLDFPCHQQQL